MKIAKLPLPSWSVHTLTVTSMLPGAALSERGPRLQEKLQELQKDGQKVHQVLETCVDGGKTWHYTIICG